jgi:hypothetical protein
MNENEVQRLLDIAWRRRLTAQEEAAVREWCRSHGETGAQLAAEFEIAQAIHESRAPAVPSNFLSQVWQEIEREDRARERTQGTVPGRAWSRWFPRLAVATLVVMTAAGLWIGHERKLRTEVAQGLAAISTAADVPDPRMLQEFDAIRVMSEASSPIDLELLTALK